MGNRPCGEFEPFHPNDWNASRKGLYTFTEPPVVRPAAPPPGQNAFRKELYLFTEQPVVRPAAPPPGQNPSPNAGYMYADRPWLRPEESSTYQRASPHSHYWPAEVQPETAPPPVIPRLLDEPWRLSCQGSRQDLLETIKAFRPPEGVRHLRVLLYGPVGAGKSSFINSVQTALRRQAANLTPSNAIDKPGPSFTVKFETHRIHRADGQDYFPLMFADTMGLEPGPSGVQPEEIKLAMKGTMMEGYKFKQRTTLVDTDPNYRNNPSLEEHQFHLLVCVLSADSPFIHQTIVNKINEIRRTARDLKIPEMAVVTKVDIVSREMEEDLKNVYKSTYLQKKMNELSASVGIPLNFMFPVKNYSRGNTERDEDMDTLLLTAVEHMTIYGNDFLKTAMTSRSELM